MSYTNINSNKSKDAVQVSWYWRTVAICASSLILGGFLVLPSTFDSQAHLRTSQTAVGIFGTILLAVGFVLDVIVCFGCGSLEFTADNVFLPAMVSSVIGFLTVPYCFIISARFTWNIPASVTTVGSAFCAVIFAGLYVLTRRRLAHSSKSVPERIDLLHRHSVSSLIPYHTHGYFVNHVANMYPAATKAPPSIVTPEEDPSNEEELQRRHMSALLNTPEPYISPSTSPFNRIEFNVDETDPPAHGYYAPAGNDNASTAYTTQQMDESWRNRNASWVSGDSRQTSATREERRREIELGRA